MNKALYIGSFDMFTNGHLDFDIREKSSISYDDIDFTYIVHR